MGEAGFQDCTWISSNYEGMRAALIWDLMDYVTSTRSSRIDGPEGTVGHNTSTQYTCPMLIAVSTGTHSQGTTPKEPDMEMWTANELGMIDTNDIFLYPTLGTDDMWLGLGQL